VTAITAVGDPHFASVFSGTAIASPRTVSLRLRFDY
jgi:hypothetical protein